MNKRRIIFRAVWVTVMLACAAGARGDYELFDNFNGYALGTINNIGGWYSTMGTGYVNLDPANLSNKVLAVTTNSGIVRKDLTITKGTMRMLFFRLRFKDQQNYSIGLSHLSAPSQFDDYGPELSMSNAVTDLRINDGGSYDVLWANMPKNVWYNVWMLINHHNETVQVWVNNIPGAAATTADRLYGVSGEGIFDFRTNSAVDLVKFYIKTGGGMSGTTGPFYIDDIYIENAFTLNLNNPLIDVTDESCWNLVDFARLAMHWLDTDCVVENYFCDLADWNLNGTVDVEDIIDVVENGSFWLYDCAPQPE